MIDVQIIRDIEDCLRSTLDANPNRINCTDAIIDIEMIFRDERLGEMDLEKSVSDIQLILGQLR